MAERKEENSFTGNAYENISDPKEIIRCAQCSRRMYAGFLCAHQRECDNRMIKCPICESSVQIHQLDQHYASNIGIHFSALTKLVLEQSNTISQLKSKLEAQEKQQPLPSKIILKQFN